MLHCQQISAELSDAIEASGQGFSHPVSQVNDSGEGETSEADRQSTVPGEDLSGPREVLKVIEEADVDPDGFLEGPSENEGAGEESAQEDGVGPEERPVELAKESQVWAAGHNKTSVGIVDHEVSANNTVDNA